MNVRRVVTLLAVAIAVGAGAGSAFGYWSGFQTGLQGTGDGGAGAVNQGAAPTAQSHGTHVIVNWGASALTTGDPVDGYIVQRYDVATDTPQTMLTNCAGVITANTCTELAMPEGDWYYTITPVFADNWRGAEGAKSGDALTGPTVFLLDRTVIGPPLPTTVTGTVSGMTPGEGLTFMLDDVTPLAGSPSVADGTGAATVSVTIPAGVTDGPHTVTVFGDDPVAPADADASIVVDTTAPTIVPFTTPAANAAGWNNTAPVEINATVDDGAGSGVAYAKYTDDGTDPRTSPTAQYAMAPFSVSTSTTFKYFIVDAAGNSSPVATLVVKIDAMPPLFTVEILTEYGHMYSSPTSPEGIPGTGWYGGAQAGGMRLKLTPIPMGGSPAVSAGFADLVNAEDFHFDGATITEPPGGPYVSSVSSWTAGTHSTPGGTIILTNAAGSTFGSSGYLYDDSTAPTGGSVDASGLVGTGGRYSNSTTLNLDLAKGTDGSGAGLADGTGQDDEVSKLMRASAPLSSSNGIANGTCGTYSAYAQVGSDDPASTFSDTVPADATCYRYRYLVPDHLDNVATYESADIKVKTAAAPSLRPTDGTITPVSGTSAQVVSGSTVYYNPALLGSFNVDSSASAPLVGVSNMTFPAITGFTGGGAVTTPNSGTTFRTTYSWSDNAASASPGTQALSAMDNAGNTATNSTAFSVVKDDVAPSGGSVDATGLGGTDGRYSPTMTLSLGLAPGTDAGSGLAASGNQLLRASASLTSDGTSNGLCGTFGAYTQVGANDPATPVTDVVPVDRTCYSYRYVVPDKVGNVATYTSPDIKVDATPPPAPTLSFSNLSHAYWNGTTVFYGGAQSSGGFRLTAGSADTTAGTSSYTFPTLPSGWTGASGGTGIRDYSWSSANPTAPSGAQTVTANNNAGRQSSSTFTATVDNTAPSGGTVTYTNGYSTLSAISVAFTTGTDTGSGLATGSGVLERASATLAAGVCGSFGSFTTAATNPTTPNSNPVTTGNCYKYRYLFSDNVGNQATYTSASIVKVDTVAPTNTLSLANAVGASLTSPSTIYYKGNAAGSFNLVDAVADAASGPASATFPLIGTTGWTHNAETVSTPAGGPYSSTAFSWTASPTNPTTKTVTGKDAAAKTTNVTVTFISDITAPVSGSITYTNGIVNAASVPVTLVNGTDAGSGIGTLVVKRDVAPLTTSTETCDAFPGTFATTVTLVGGADTSVSSGNCYQYRYVVTDKVGNAVTYTSANVAKVDTSGPRVTAIASQQSGGGAGDGQLQVGDKLILTFNQSLSAASVPATFAGAAEISPGSFVDVTLNIPGITSGALGTGSPFYMSAPSTTATFGGTTALVNNGTATTVTISVTSLSGTATAPSSGTLVFIPASTIKDGGGNAAAGSFSTASAFKLF
jgi:chitobiase/beta-hexosaminidase-like protein